MDPASMAIASVGSSMLGGVVNAASASQAGAIKSQMGYYQAGVAMQNAEIAKQNAIYASVKGEADTMRYGMGARQQRGQIIAQQSASGVDVNSGSARDVQRGFDTVSKMDMDQIRADAARVAYNYNQQASQYTQEAWMQMQGASAAKSAGSTNALASLISGATSVADKWYSANQLGMFKNFSFGV